MTSKYWLVSAMIGLGKSAQYLMTDPMTRSDAYDLAEEILQRIEDGHWVEIGNTYVNPRSITTIRVIREKSEEKMLPFVHNYNRMY